MHCMIYIKKGQMRVSLRKYDSTGPDEQLVSEFVIEPEYVKSGTKGAVAAEEIFGRIDINANYAMKYTLERLLEKFLSHLFTVETIRSCASMSELEKLFDSYGLKVRLEPRDSPSSR